MGRAFSIFRQKIDSLEPSEMDIKVFIPVPTFVYSLKSVFFKWEKEKEFLSWESEIK